MSSEPTADYECLSDSQEADVMSGESELDYYRRELETAQADLRSVQIYAGQADDAQGHAEALLDEAKIEVTRLRFVLDEVYATLEDWRESYLAHGDPGDDQLRELIRNIGVGPHPRPASGSGSATPTGSSGDDQ